MYFSSAIISDFKAYAISKGVSIKLLDKYLPKSETQKYITYQDITTLINGLVHELDDDFLGLHIGERIALKVTKYVDSIIQHSQTLEDAFANAAYYSKSISDALDCTLEKKRQKYVVVFEENPNWSVYNTIAKRQILDLTLLSCLKSLIAYTGKTYYPLNIHFQLPRPKNINEYYRLFNCSLKFNTEKTEITFEKQIFDNHSKEVKLGLLENLQNIVEQELKNLKSENELVYQLKKIILKQKPERILLADAAQKLNMSNRTLQRKLKYLNTSFKEVEQVLQLKLAKTYLNEKTKDIDEISYLLGFSESSAFIRFFKSITKQTPGNYQKKLLS